MIENKQRGIINKDQYKTREDLSEMAREDFSPEIERRRQPSYDEFDSRPRKYQDRPKLSPGERKTNDEFLIIMLKQIIFKQQKKIRNLRLSKEQLNKEIDEKTEKYFDLQDKVDLLKARAEGLGKDIENPTKVPFTDERLKNMEDYLDKVQTDSEQNELVRKMIKDEKEYGELAKENSEKILQLKSNMDQLLKNLNTIDFET